MSGFAVFTGVAIAELADGRYRPPNWNQPPTTSMTVTLPPASSVTSVSYVNGQPVPEAATPAPPAQMPTTFFFDAVLRIEHNQEATLTKHPVQVGPALVDHMYLQPARVILDVGMSDAMQSFMAGQYSSGKSKSVSAYQTFLQIQASRAPITLQTRLNTYYNMQIVDIRASDTSQTSRGLRCVIYLEQIISATVSQTTVSERPNATNSTNEGTKTPSSPSTDALSGISTIPQP
jgi:hypothetical protein